MSIVVTPLIEATKDEWLATTQPIILNRLVYESDTGNFKIGDGVSTFAQLPYFNNLTPASFLVLVQLADIIPFVETTNSSSGSSISGGILGQALVSGGSNPPTWSTILSAVPPSNFSGNINTVGLFNDTLSAVAHIGFLAESSTYSDIDFVLTPIGQGGFIIGPLPDGTNAGGNPRGSKSVDLQIYRTDPTHVASGANSVITGGQENTNQGLLSFIGGGASNSIFEGVTHSVVVGGETNFIVTSEGAPDHVVIVGGYSNVNGSQYSIIGGGSSNQMPPYGTFYNGIFGGQGNTITVNYGFIGGGSGNNIVAGDYSVIAGGQANTILQYYGFLGGGGDNQIAVGSDGYSVVVGGLQNQVTADYSFVGGGKNNAIQVNYSFIGGGRTNSVNSNDYQVVVGGQANSGYGDHAALVGGMSNQANAAFVFMGGGQTNQTFGPFAVICGGQNNEVNNQYSFIGGGTNHSIVSDYSSVVGGEQNYISGGDHNHLSGGLQCQIDNCTYSVIGGGAGSIISSSNYAGIFSGNGCSIEGDYGFIGTGYFNQSLTGFGFVGTGSNNTAENYCVVVNGYLNNAYNSNSFIGTGTSLQVYGAYSTILNGVTNTASGNYSTILNGQNANDNGRTGWTGYSTGTFGHSGDQQAGFTILSGSVSATDTVVLTAGNINNTYTAPSTNNIINLVPFSVLHIKGTVLGSDTVTQDSGAWSVEFVIKQGSNFELTAIVGSPKINLIAADAALVNNVELSIAADTVNGGVALSIGNSAGWTNLTYWEANLTVTELAIPTN